MDIVDLRQFYATPLGRQTAACVNAALSSVWRSLSDERLVGFGFANPYLDRFAPDAERSFSFMPAAQGAMPWPPGRARASALVFEENLPLPDASIDRLLLVHALEFCENPLETLGEIWRVLSPGGRLVIVVPNRRGVWARVEHTPFASGQPYSGGQLARLMRRAMFTPTGWSDALHFPPSKRPMVLRAAPTLERLGHRFAPAFAGVVVMEATKQIVQGLPVRERRSQRVFVPVLAPQSAARLANETGDGRHLPNAPRIG